MVECLTYTVKEASAILGVSFGTMYRLVRSNQVPNIKIGGRYFLPQQSFLLWFEKSIQGDNKE